MIRLERERAESRIADVYHGDKRIARELELLKMKKRDSPEKVNFKNKGGRWGAAKDQLKTETHGKCAYCEADTQVVAHGDVEHYRPKSKYWWLAYCYDNYLFSCQICNQSFKSDNFPVEATPLTVTNVTSGTSDATLNQRAGTLGVNPLDPTAVNEFLSKSQAEKAHIPDPYDPKFSPRKLFIWEEDDDNGQVQLKRKGNSALARRTFEACEEHLGLNREELLRLRWVQFKLMRTLKGALERIEDEFGTDDELAVRIRDQLTDMVADEAEYADMARFYIGTVWQLGIPVTG